MKFGQFSCSPDGVDRFTRVRHKNDKHLENSRVFVSYRDMSLLWYSSFCLTFFVAKKIIIDHGPIRN